MWLEVKQDDNYFFINTENITTIVRNKRTDAPKVGIYGATSSVVLEFESMKEANAFMAGFNLALNGLDFISGDDSVKPLFSAKNETLYRYMMFKEAMGERK
jgi:hypothetical protein